MTNAQPDPMPPSTPGADEPAPELTPDDPWRRQDPRMLLIHPVQQLIKFFPAVIGLVIAGSTQSDGEPWWFGLIAVAGAIALGVMRWATTRYRVTTEHLQLRTGLLSRNTLTTPVDRVRTVDVTASLLHRVLGLAEVKIGTGADETKLALDGLPAAQAGVLRDELIHLRNAPDTESRPTAAGDASQVEYDGVDVGAEPDVEIARLDPAWIRYALFTSTGIVSAAAIFGIGWQIIDRSGANFTDTDVVRQGEDVVRDLGILVSVAMFVVIGLVVVLLLSLCGYVLSYWGYRLTRNQRGGTLQVSRGLFTTRAVTIEERRLRGVEMSETLAMRPAQGATLDAITTGLGTDSGESALLLPPAPASVARRLTDAVLAVPGTLEVPLRVHGPAAARRRWVRALAGGAVLAAAVIGATVWWVPALAALAVVPLLVAPWLARDRARNLGHALTPRYLVTRSGSIVRSTCVVERSGVIGVTLRESFFQRRAGLTTLVMATAAGQESYTVPDVPVQDGVEVAAQLLPGHVEPLFRTSATSVK